MLEVTTLTERLAPIPKTVHLWPDHLALAERLVADGRFEDVHDVAFDAFSLLEDAEAARDARLAKLRAQLDEGLADIEAGRTVSAEEVFAELDQIIADAENLRTAAE